MGPSDEWIATRTDKFAHGYFAKYRDLCISLGTEAAVCEIGVQGGGSLEVWQAFFTDGLVVGVDGNALSYWPEGTVKVVCDQADDTLTDKLRTVLREDARIGFDLIIDDASHNGELSAKTFELTWPLLRSGGFWVLEDWQVALPEFPGAYGPSMLRLAESFLQRLTRVSDVEDIYYRYGMAVLQKRDRSL
jgi:hypothetical protein